MCKIPCQSRTKVQKLPRNDGRRIVRNDKEKYKTVLNDVRNNQYATIVVVKENSCLTMAMAMKEENYCS